MLRVFTAFSGYDSQCLALQRIGLPFELVGWSEIDKHVIKAHNALFPQYANRNYGDISAIDWAQVPDFDLFTYSSPCQDFSIAGQKRGGDEGSGTRSSLLWECRQAIIAKRPKYLLFENVPALISSKFIELFNKWQAELESYGYTNYTQILAAQDFDVPQHRKRVFMVSIYGGGSYEFPQGKPTELRIKDILEDKVDESYYLSDKMIAGLNAHAERQKDKVGGFCWKPTDGNVIGRTLTAGGNVRPCDNFISVNPKRKLEYKGFTQQISPTLRATDYKIPHCVTKGERIRRLTEREYFRLMGLKESEIDMIQAAGISRTQQYKMAGNSIVVNVLAAIFDKLFINKKITAPTLFVC
ncbi:MAG: DNA cytosine methyltransferase [Bacteroides sp.]|nr:DNA cytosine methyltransferase [Bacteroides sp.]MCM1403879.1 DNA cytosine methyltransferase [Bacteroides sp.]MCM1443680.1 DNA cytosine methyltransferase [Muribaculum sp.]